MLDEEISFPPSSTLKGLLFLRILCPAIIEPFKYGFGPDELPPESKSALLAAAKVLLRLVNLANNGNALCLRFALNLKENLKPEKYQGQDRDSVMARACLPKLVSFLEDWIAYDLADDKSCMQLNKEQEDISLLVVQDLVSKYADEITESIVANDPLLFLAQSENVVLEAKANFVDQIRTGLPAIKFRKEFDFELFESVKNAFEAIVEGSTRAMWLKKQSGVRMKDTYFVLKWVRTQRTQRTQCAQYAQYAAH
jgi:hypothetical protein